MNRPALTTHPTAAVDHALCAHHRQSPPRTDRQRAERSARPASAKTQAPARQDDRHHSPAHPRQPGEPAVPTSHHRRITEMPRPATGQVVRARRRAPCSGCASLPTANADPRHRRTRWTHADKSCTRHEWLPASGARERAPIPARGVSVEDVEAIALPAMTLMAHEFAAPRRLASTTGSLMCTDRHAWRGGPAGLGQPGSGAPEP